MAEAMGMTTFVVVLRLRRMVLISARPIRPFPSVKGWMDSNCAWALAACGDAASSHELKVA